MYGEWLGELGRGRRPSQISPVGPRPRKRPAAASAAAVNPAERPVPTPPCTQPPGSGPMSPSSQADGDDLSGLAGKGISAGAAGIDDAGTGPEDPVAQPAAAQELPDGLDRAQLGRARGRDRCPLSNASGQRGSWLSGGSGHLWADEGRWAAAVQVWLLNGRHLMRSRWSRTMFPWPT
jgi:hypothetical protein